MNRLLPLRFRVLLPTLGLLLLLAACAKEPPAFRGTLMPDPAPAPDFSLLSGGDRSVSLSSFAGEVVLIYFGYTYCPDVCPLTMSDLRRVQEEVGDEGLQVLLITVDPRRDTPEIAHAYASSFHPAFIGLSGAPEEIAAVAADWGVFVQAGEPDDSGNYPVDHTARVFAVDPAGRYRLSYAFETPPEDIAADVRLLLGE